MGRGALDGIVVLDATQALSGPFCGMVLGDIGADVIKIELPEGDGVRRWGPPFAGDSGPTYVGFNRNKRSVVIDLRTSDGRSAFLKMVTRADVVIENFRPGTMQRFGLGYETLREHKSNLVYCAISGYGQSGPLAKQPAMDLMIQAISGMMSLTGEPDGRPAKAAAPITDLMGGFAGAFSILAAIRERDRTGLGRFIDVSMLDVMLTMLGQSIVAYMMSGEPPRRQGTAHQLMAPYQSFRTATREIVVSLAIQKRWELLCSLPEFKHLLGKAGYATQPERNANRLALCREIEDILMTQPAEYWLEALHRLRLPVAPVNSLSEILNEPHLAHRGSLLEVEYPPGSGNRIKIPGMPWRDAASDKPLRNPPAIGEHTAQVFREFGITPDAGG